MDRDGRGDGAEGAREGGAEDGLEDGPEDFRAHLPPEAAYRILEYADGAKYRGMCRFELRPPLKRRSRFQSHDEYPDLQTWMHPLECGRKVVSVLTEDEEDITAAESASTVFIRHGPGAFSFPNGDEWKGQHAYGYFHGEGVHTHSSQTTIKTRWAWDQIEIDPKGSDDSTLRTRPVILKYANGDTYEGRLRVSDGAFDDLVEAVFTHRNGAEFRGQWVDGGFTGHGRMSLPWGYSCVGEFLMGVAHGDDCVETGSRVGGLKEGEASSGVVGDPGEPLFVYRGAMRNGLRHGAGKMHFEGGMSWQGEFAEGNPIDDDEGTLAFARLGTNKRVFPSYPLRNQMFSYLNIKPSHRGSAALIRR
jgi:hypothetical protein